MADYGGRGGGDSLRDALNSLYPMTGLGEYTAGFPPRYGGEDYGSTLVPNYTPMVAPPQTGVPAQPSGPVPLSRPVIQPRVPAQGGPVLPPIQGLQDPRLQGRLGAGAGGMAVPLGANTDLTLRGQVGPNTVGPPNYAAMLGLSRAY